MSKRFTDTEKWEDPWFRNLLKEYQFFWIYLLDRCDNAGVWKVDFEAAEFYLKQKCEEKEILNVFKDRVIAFDNGQRWFIPKFITFQYGLLDEACRPHNSVINLLKGFGLINRLSTEIKGIHTLKDKTKTRQDKDKTKISGHFEGCICARCRK